MRTLSTPTKGTLRLSIFSGLLLLIAIGMVAARLPHLAKDLQARGSDGLGDFNYYYYAFSIILKQPFDASQLYDHNHVVEFLHQIGIKEIGVHSFYGYPPQFAVFFSRLGSFEITTAKILWSVMSVLFLVIAIIFTIKLAYRGGKYEVLIGLVAVAILCRPILDELYWGQSNALLFFLLAATFLCIERDYRYAAGVFLALAVVFKVTPIAVAGLLLLRREWRTVIATIVFSIVVTAITALYVGWNIVFHYLTSDLSRLNKQNLLVGGAPFNSSVRGALQTLSAKIGMPLSTTALEMVSTVFAAAVCLLAAYLVLRRNTDRRMDYALATTTMLVASPVLESVHLVAVLIPVLILIGTALENRTHGTRVSALGFRGEMLLCTLAVVLLMFSPKLVSYTIAILIIYALCVARYIPSTPPRVSALSHDEAAARSLITQSE
jgi:Gpi18-like mannosyltransferase